MTHHPPTTSTHSSPGPPALSNALDMLCLQPSNTGYTNGSIHRVTGEGAMVGWAVTARMVVRNPGEDSIPVSRLHKAISDIDGPDGE